MTKLVTRAPDVDLAAVLESRPALWVADLDAGYRGFDLKEGLAGVPLRYDPPFEKRGKKS